jgi:hypothetical protein
MPKYLITIDTVNRTSKVEQIPVDSRFRGHSLEPIDEAGAVLACERMCDDYPAAVNLTEAMAYGIQVGKRYGNGRAAAAARHRRLTLEEMRKVIDGPVLQALPVDLDLGRVAYDGYCCASDGKSLISGGSLPAWPEVKAPVQNAWRAAAIAILNAIFPAEAA